MHSIDRQQYVDLVYGGDAQANGIVHWPTGAYALPPEELDSLVPDLSGRVTWLNMPLMPFSATQVRSLASRGAPLSGFVPEGVEAYIREHQLYGAG